MRSIAWATVAAVALVVAYLALGGASYAPAKVADPCAPRDWRDPSGVEEVAEQIALSGLDGAACELHVSREEMVLALANSESRERFAREHGITDQRLEELVREGLLRAIDDAEQADALNPTIADLLRSIARNVPVDELLNLLDRLPGLALG
jgi:AcrR family transcriptional regulator